MDELDQRINVPTQGSAGADYHHGRISGRRDRPMRNSALSLRPAQVGPPPSSRRAIQQPNTSETSSASADQDCRPNAADNSQRRRRGERRAARGRNQRVQEQRLFSGSLTTESQVGGTVSNIGTVHGEIVSSREEPVRTAGPPRVSRPRKLSRSSAPDIATRIHEDIGNRNYECAICTSEVLRNSKVWSCDTCWTVFHLGCIKQWVANSKAHATEEAERSGRPIGEQLWRCPGCNLPQENENIAYSCWCGKDHDPRSITGLPPHSCGQTCGKERVIPQSCPHACELLCHAGPCPPCPQMGPTQACFCGKTESQRRCVDTLYESGWSCGNVCGESMPCGEHFCQRECHQGLCGACEVRIDSRCYCGQEEKTIICCDKETEEVSKRAHVAADGTLSVDVFNGAFRCNNPCGRVFACGRHYCQLPCHPTEAIRTHCPRAPDMVTHCPCAKTPISELVTSPRQTCEDPIPNCKKPCLKPLPCGHSCQQACHTGECMPCLRNTDIKCRCGRTSSQTICHQGHEEPPQCMRTCHVTLNCGRHACGERCCTGERKAVERQASRRKGRPLGSSRPAAEDFEAEHICTRQCGRMLKCGNHICHDLCHKGPCGTCREAVFDEVSCHCGRTVLQPPLPCGTQAPPCRWNCERPKSCGHPQVQHNCHTDADSCPKCPFLTTKQCACGKRALKNQPCWTTDPRCGLACDIRLKCGVHFCRKTCHPPNACEDADQKCSQICGRAKKLCGHPCEEICHAPYPCTQDRPCSAKRIITCLCQHKKAEVRCGVSASPAQSAVERTLTCDDECARLERNRELAAALAIEPTTHSDGHVPYSAETLSQYASLPPRISGDIEATMRAFASDESAKRHRFRPMKGFERSFVHTLAEDFAFDSESVDPEPHRHVALFKTSRFVSAPNKTLRDAARARQARAARQQAEASDRYHAQQASKVKSAATSKSRNSFNGFVLSQPGFGLTTDDLASEVATTLSVPLDIHFLASGDVALLARTGVTESSLFDAKPGLARVLNGAGMGQVQLARIASDGSCILFRESEVTLSEPSTDGGWSQVAARSAASKPPPTTASVGVKSAFTVLTSANALKSQTNGAISKKKEKKARREEKKAEMSVIEDWEAEMDNQEKHEAQASTNSAAGATKTDDDTNCARELFNPNS